MNSRMDEFAIKTSEQGFINAWVPRSLIVDGEILRKVDVTQEGLCPLRIGWVNGQVNSIKGIQTPSKMPSDLVLPRFVEPHCHIDKIFTWKPFPNLLGTYEHALSTNLEEYKAREIQDLSIRVEKALTMALRNGIRSIRSHIDSFGAQANENWDLLHQLKKKWKSLIHLQYVALVPLEFWGTIDGRSFASRVANQGDLLGGVITPPFEDQKCFKSLETIIKLANNLGCGIDLHIDESQDYPAAGLKLLVKVLDRTQSSIPITCSHSSSMGLLPRKQLEDLAKRLAFHKIKVIALPLTNSWLLGRKGRTTTVQRPLAPIYQLQEAGIVVAVGADNVNDHWFPLGSLDPIQLMAFSMPIAHLSPWERLGLSPFITSASNILDLEWNGTIENGSPASWVVFKSTSWVEVLSTTPKRQVIINGVFLDEKFKSNQTEA